MTINENINHVIKRQNWIIANPEADRTNQMIFDLKRLKRIADTYPHFRADDVAKCIKKHNILLAKAKAKV